MFNPQYPFTYYQVNLMMDGLSLMSSPIYTDFTSFCKYVSTIRSFQNSSNSSNFSNSRNFRILEMIYYTPYYFTYQGMFNYYGINDKKFNIVDSSETTRNTQTTQSNVNTCSDLHNSGVNDASSNYGEGNIDFDTCYHGVNQNTANVDLSSETRYSYEHSLPDPIVDTSISYNIDTSPNYNTVNEDTSTVYSQLDDIENRDTNHPYDNVYFNTHSCYEQNSVDTGNNANFNSQDNMLSNEQCGEGEEFSNDTWEVVQECTNNVLNHKENEYENEYENEGKGEEDKYNEFYEFEIRDHGKGYMVTCPPSNKHYGEKYFHNGWWFPSSNGWFFKKEFYNDLIALGMVDMDNKQDMIFSNTCYEYYGDNLLLLCYEDHPNYGDLEFYGGNWDYKADGWLFTNDMEQYLIDNGAVYEFDEYSAFDNMTVKCLYKGRHTFLVTPSMLSKYHGINTFRVSKYVGNWNKEMKGWIFNRAYEKFFTSRGARLE